MKVYIQNRVMMTI